MGGRNQTFTNNFKLNSLAAAHPGAKVQVRMIHDKLKSINLPVVLCSPSQLANGWTKGTLFIWMTITKSRNSPSRCAILFPPPPKLLPSQCWVILIAEPHYIGASHSGTYTWFHIIVCSFRPKTLCRRYPMYGISFYLPLNYHYL